MDLLKPLVKNFSRDYFIRRDGLNIAPHLKALNASQFFSPDEISALQLERLKAILRLAYNENNFYRKRFDDAGFNPETFKDFADLKKIPYLTKDDIRNSVDELFTEGYNRENTIHKRTGGSTGVPLHNYMDIDATSAKKAATQRHNAWANHLPGGYLAAVWGDTDKKIPFKARIRNALTERAFYLDTLKFDEGQILPFIRKIKKFRPPVMMGHAHSIFRLAEYVREHNISGLKFRGIITTAMVLNPSERTVIEEVFASPVFNRYGCEELSIISSECEMHEGMHIFAEGLYVEFDGDDTSLPRPLIITDLLNRAMPMIRYEIGDYGIMTEGYCPCGRGLPRLKEVSGRTADFLYTPEKRPVFGISILDTFVIHIPGFKQVQIIQDKYDHLDFFIIKDERSFSETSLKKLAENVREIFGPNMKYDLRFVDKIRQTERGKYRFSICMIEDKDR